MGNITRRGLMVTALAGAALMAASPMIAFAEPDKTVELMRLYDHAQMVFAKYNVLKDEKYPNDTHHAYRYISDLGTDVDLEYADAYEALCKYYYDHANFPELTNDYAVNEIGHIQTTFDMGLELTPRERLLKSFETGNLNMFFYKGGEKGNLPMSKSSDYIRIMRDAMSANIRIMRDAAADTVHRHMSVLPYTQEEMRDSNVTYVNLLHWIESCQTKLEDCIYYNPEPEAWFAQSNWGNQFKYDTRGVLKQYMDHRRVNMKFMRSESDRTRTEYNDARRAKLLA